ncbi:hypothetical protein ILFOPFJJ_01511 [Ensifer psoraleae]|uniref:HEPN domain-containing protein n=1 Tax=Sinorhizobium psoraleae TaxID=520838 RepID=UPI001568B6E9|nr:HEPN domain-containing protein [Sinorhizobium psoraleae]NRP70630.1 hypothetical protein [Sinorhizobium psoraleae]
MTELTQKQSRVLLSYAAAIFKPKSLIVPRSIGDIPKDKTLLRELRTGAGETIYLTDHGLSNFERTVELIDKCDYFEGKAEYSDIWGAWRKVVEGWLGRREMPESANEVLDAVSSCLNLEMRSHNFLVPVSGAVLNKESSYQVGSMTILRDPVSWLESAGVSCNSSEITSLLKASGGRLWLLGSAYGTAKVARRMFSEYAALTIGLLAIAAASKYEHGAAGFRISTGMTAEDALGRSAWMSWDETEKVLTTNYTFPRGQPFAVDAELSQDSDGMQMIQLAFSILDKAEKTEVEVAIGRAVYWFYDAHRDSALVMRMVKYWSCVEAFFSLERERITHSVSSGLASILTFGGFRFVDVDKYSETKKNISQLYDLRSQAVHRGDHRHVTEENVAQFSQWVAWMIIEITSLSACGYTTLQQLKREVDRLDSIALPTQDGRA